MTKSFIGSMIEWAWAAGLLEGEGSFCCSKEGYTRIYCTSTDLDVLERLKDIMEYGTICGPYQYSTHKKPFYRYTCSRKEHVDSIVNMIRPLMGKRRLKQIETMLDKRKNK